jgi:hypothetical protein
MVLTPTTLPVASAFWNGQVANRLIHGAPGLAQGPRQDDQKARAAGLMIEADHGGPF